MKSKGLRKERGTFRRAPRHSIEVYIEDEELIQKIRDLIATGTFKSGTAFGRQAFEAFIRNEGWKEV